MAHDAPDRQARSEHVAKSVASAGAWDIHGRHEEHRVTGKLTLQRADLVLAAAAGEIREPDAHLLQAQHVRIGETASLARDARGVDDAVDAAAPLDVPGDQPHCYFRFLRLSATISSCRVKARSSGLPSSQESDAITPLAIWAGVSFSMFARNPATSFMPSRSATSRACTSRWLMAARLRFVGQRSVSFSAVMFFLYLLDAGYAT